MNQHLHHLHAATGAGQNTTAHRALGGNVGLFSTSSSASSASASPSAFASRVAMGHFSHNRPGGPSYSNNSVSGGGGGSSTGSGTPPVSHLSAFAAQASALSGHARSSQQHTTRHHTHHTHHHHHHHPTIGSPSQQLGASNVASPPANANTRRHEQLPPIARYRLVPPKSTPPLHYEHVSEYPDYYPHRPDQPEHQLSISVLQNGYKTPALFENEAMSARDILHDHWKDPRTLTALDEFFVDVARYQSRSLRLPKESSWRPPVKYRVSDLKKEQWLLDLSNLSIPLHTLAHSIPTGLKGEKLLEALSNRQPPLVRAVWSIKVTSLAELESGSTFTLSLELKNILAQFLEAQLAELAGGPRSASTPSMGYMTGRMVGNAFRPWQNEESRQRWTSRWWYSTKLAESLHNEGLVEQRYFLKWLLDRLATSGLEQTVVLLPLVTALLEDIVRSRALSRLLIDTLLSKLQTVFRLTGLDGKSRRFQHVIDEITVTLQTICIQWPDALVQPKAWHRYDTTLKQLLAIDSVAITATDQITVLKTYLTRIEQRNLAFTVIIKEPELSTIKSLDGLLQPTLREVTTQKWINQARQQFTTSVEQLCRWAICTENNEDRIYIAPALLAKLRQIMSKSIQVELQSILIDFLEQSTEDIQRLVRFYDQLIQRNVFSYTRYLRRLVARGTLQNMVSESFSQRQTDILAALPVKDMNSAVANQRRILLYGVNVTLNPEDEMVDVLVTRLSSKLPYLTATESTAVDNVSLAASSLTIDHTALPTPPSLSMSGSSGNGIGAQESDIGHRRVIQSVSTMTEPLVDDATLDDELQLGFDEDTLGLLKESSRYCQTRITRHWLMPLVKQYVVKEVQIGIDNWRVITSPGSSLLNARQLATIIMIMELVNDSQTLIELVLWVLDHTEDQTMGLICIDTLLRHETCWMALDWQEKVFETVTLKYARLSSKGGDFVVLNGLKRLISHGYGTIEQVKARLTDPGFTLIMTSTPSGLPSLSATTQLPQLTTPNPSSISHGHSSMTGPSATSATPSGLIQLPDRLDDMRFQPLVLDTRQITTLAQSIWFKYHAEPNWFARLLESLNVSLDEHAIEFVDAINARRKLQVFANLINHLIRGDITLRNVLQQWMTDRLNTDEQKMASTAHRNWRLILMLMLISRDCYDIIYGLENVILPLLIGAIGNEQQQTWDRTCIADLLSWLAAALLQVSVSSSSSSSSSPSQFLQLSTKDALSLETRISTSIEHLDQCKPIISLLIPLIQLEIALPLSDALRHQCHWLRCQLLKTKWFKRISLKDSVAFARHLVAQRPLVSLPPTTDTFNIVLHSGLVMLGASESDNSPSDTSYLEAFSYALCHLSPWNISSNQAIIHLTLTGLGYDMYDKKVSSSLEEEKATTMEMGDSTTMNIDNPPNNDQSIACAFFDAVVLQSNTDLQLLFEIVSSLPACVLRLLIDHGQQLLDASMSQFPVNVLVFPGLANCPATLAASLKRLYTIMLLLLARADKFKEEMDKSLENMACSLLAQLQRFVDHSKVLAIMTSKALDFSEASKHIEQDQTVLQDQPNDKTTLDQLRLCMELRLRLVVPLLERLLEQPQACATGNWIITLLELLTSSLMADTSYFDNSNSKDISVQQSSIFEFSLDLLSFLLDEIPKDVRTHVLETMRTLEAQLDLPQVYAERIRRVLPFKVRYAYQYTTPTELAPLLDPWRWLEDTPIIMSRHPASVSTPAPFTPNTGGIVSTPGTGDDTVIVPIKPDTRNDTPLSLVLFGARRLQRVDSPLVEAIRNGNATAGWSCPTAAAISPANSQQGGLHAKLASPEPGELAEDGEAVPMRQKRPAEDELPDI